MTIMPLMPRTLPALLSVLLCCPMLLCADQALVDFSKELNLAAVETHDVKLSLNDGRLRMETGQEERECGIVFKAPDGRWNLSAFRDLAVELKNAGQNRVRVFCEIDNPRADGSKSYMTQSIEVSPGEEKSLRVALPRRFSASCARSFRGCAACPDKSRFRASIWPR